MAEITRRTRRRGRHRSHTTEPGESGSYSDVSATRPTSVNRNMDTAPAPIPPKMPRSLLELIHIHLWSATHSNIVLRRYLTIFFALVAGVLVLAGGVYVVSAAAGVHLWNALLLSIGATVTPLAIARKRARKRD